MTDAAPHRSDEKSQDKPNTQTRADEQELFSIKHGIVSVQEVQAAAASNKDLPGPFPSPEVIAGQAAGDSIRKPYQKPDSNYRNEPLGLQADGKTLVFGQYYSSEFAKYTKSSDYLKSVEDISKLDLPGAKLKNEMAPLIAQYPNLRELNLQGGEVKEALPHLKSLQKLERLNLDSSYVDDGDIKNVAAAKSIKDLQLRNNYGLTDDALRSIATMPDLKSLSIDSREITADGIKALSKTGIEKLTPPVFLEDEEADSAGKAFAEIKTLKELNIPLSRMTDSGMEQLAKSNSMEKLNLSNSFNLTADSIDHLAKMTNLKELDLSYASKLRPSEIVRLQAALPNCQIKTDLDLKGLDVASDDRREADKIGHNLWLLSGITQEPKRFADQVLTDFSQMSQKQIDLTARLLESGPHQAKVERNPDNSIKSITYDYEPQAWQRVREKPWPGFLFLPDALGIEARQRVYRGSGHDVTIAFEQGKISLEAKQYHDITGKGFWKGSDTMSTAYKPTIKDSRVPYYKP